MPRISPLALCGLAFSAPLVAEPVAPSLQPPALPNIALRFSENPATELNPLAALDVPKLQPLAFVGPNLREPEPSFDPFVIVPKKNNIGAMPTVSERPDIDFKVLVIAPPQTALNPRQNR